MSCGFAPRFSPGRAAVPCTAVNSPTDSAFDDLVTRAANGDPCLELALFSASDGFLRETRQMGGPKLNIFPVGGYLEYRGRSQSNPIVVAIEGSGLVRRALRPECR